MLIDFHTHIFPDALAARTLQKLSDICSNDFYTDGTTQGTLHSFAGWGVDYAVVLHTATRAGQERTINAFAKKLQDEHPNLFSFGALYPDSPDALELIDEIAALGFRGIKLHPSYQHFWVREERYFPLYEAIAKHNLILTMHAGWDPVEPETVFAPPADIALVARAFPQLTLIAAHLGGMCRWDEVERDLVGLPNVYFDTAMSCLLCPADQYERIIRAHGPARVLFGTDCPWSPLPQELARLEQSSFTEAEKDLIRYKNACRLLQIPT